jgi:hypothetical protein
LSAPAAEARAEAAQRDLVVVVVGRKLDAEVEAAGPGETLQGR